VLANADHVQQIETMSKTQPAREEGDSPSAEVESASFSQDEILEMLSNQRRRFVIHALKRANGELSLSELAEQVAGWEYDKPVDRLDHEERKRVRNALRQFHLSKMAEYGFIEFDKSRGVVSLSERARAEDFYVDSLTGGDVPWGLYYLGFSAVSVLVLGAAHVGVPGVPWLTPGVCATCVVVALAVSSVGHFYDNYYRMRLGGRDEPAEVGER